ncbi:RNA polymerase sigma factor [Pedobacter psychroterrae]|uniref:RNA polymerase sigma-70 factor n=1 Tax=Pedobacter psychroterrae TaxID=2530453 RepID=A0A4R0NPD9_9SPHI|nr:RNA polymerase sigma-70 factor [Pedobacter psychroterrae]TCD02852.1 RNA polymerase sigma-70 factor [Pedobacter psychroterrae]
MLADIKMQAYDKLSDQELIALLRQRKHAAFTEIYNRHWTTLFIHAVKMLKDEDEAVDVIQDVFTALWHKSADLDINTSLTAYLYTSVRNRIISVIRHGKVHEDYMDSLSQLLKEGDFVTDNQVRFNELTVQIEKEISSLPGKMRQIFIMSRVNGLTHKQISSELNISEETVKKQIYNALKILKVKLSPCVFLMIL